MSNLLRRNVIKHFSQTVFHKCYKVSLNNLKVSMISYLSHTIHAGEKGFFISEIFYLTVSALQSKSLTSDECTSKECSAVSHLSNFQSCSGIGLFLSAVDCDIVNVTVTSYFCAPLVFKFVKVILMFRGEYYLCVMLTFVVAMIAQIQCDVIGCN